MKYPFHIQVVMSDYAGNTYCLYWAKSYWMSDAFKKMSLNPERNQHSTDISMSIRWMYQADKYLQIKSINKNNCVTTIRSEYVCMWANSDGTVISSIIFQFADMVNHTRRSIRRSKGNGDTFKKTVSEILKMQIIFYAWIPLCWTLLCPGPTHDAIFKYIKAVRRSPACDKEVTWLL